MAMDDGDDLRRRQAGLLSIRSILWRLAPTLRAWRQPDAFFDYGPETPPPDDGDPTDGAQDWPDQDWPDDDPYAPPSASERAGNAVLSLQAVSRWCRQLDEAAREFVVDTKWATTIRVTAASCATDLRMEEHFARKDLRLSPQTVETFDRVIRTARRALRSANRIALRDVIRCRSYIDVALDDLGVSSAAPPVTPQEEGDPLSPQCQFVLELLRSEVRRWSVRGLCALASKAREGGEVDRDDTVASTSAMHRHLTTLCKCKLAENLGGRSGFVAAEFAKFFK